MYHQFLKTATLETAYNEYVEPFKIQKSSILCNIENCRGKVLTKNYPALTNLPGFRRSTVDGYAVNSKTTFGASQQNPVYLPLAGEILMGEVADFTLKPGFVAEISTGGALPEGADSVVMIEYTDKLKDNTIEIKHTVAPLENIIGEADDIACGELLLKKGAKLTSANIGLLAAMGINEIEVASQLTTAIIATGDEIVSHKCKEVPKGCVRDVNNPLLLSMLNKSDCKISDMGIVKDNEKDLNEIITKSVADNDVTLISGGSSAGARDFTYKIISELEQGEVLFHGLMISPGKPVILGRAGQKVIIGLPGHPVSLTVVMRFLVLPLINRLKGLVNWKPEPSGKVSLNEKVSSKPGREEFVRVFAELNYTDTTNNDNTGNDGIRTATVVRGPSGSIASLSRANGFAHIGIDKEGLAKDEITDFYALED